MSDVNFDPAYEAVVALIISLGSEELIENENYTHARTLIRALIGKQEADGYIGIFTEKLDPRGFAPTETLDAFRMQFDRGVEVRLLFQKTPDMDAFRNNPFYRQFFLDEKYLKLIKTKVLKPEYQSISTHMVTPNKKAFRIETDHEKTKALASFNNSFGASVRDKFEELFSDELSVPLTFH